MRTQPPFDVTGQGEPLLVLSGYGLAASTLAPVIAPLAESFTCITFDYPGSGSAKRPVYPLTIPGLAASAVRLLDKLGIASAHVLGMSLGGMVAQELAIRFPDRVRSLVLVATTAGGVRAVTPGVVTLLSGLSAASGQFPSAASAGLHGLLYQGLAASMHDTSHRLGRIQAKTLILHGDRDLLVPVSNAHLMHDAIPGSILQVVPGAGHLYLFDHTESAGERVRSWIEGSRPFVVGQRTLVQRAVEHLDRSFALQTGCVRATCGSSRRAGVLAQSLARSLFAVVGAARGQTYPARHPS